MGQFIYNNNSKKSAQVTKRLSSFEIKLNNPCKI
jgi:hypothetical protein